MARLEGQGALHSTADSDWVTRRSNLYALDGRRRQTPGTGVQGSDRQGAFPERIPFQFRLAGHWDHPLRRRPDAQTAGVENGGAGHWQTHFHRYGGDPRRRRYCGALHHGSELGNFPPVFSAHHRDGADGHRSYPAQRAAQPQYFHGFEMGKHSDRPDRGDGGSAVF